MKKLFIFYFFKNYPNALRASYFHILSENRENTPVFLCFFCKWNLFEQSQNVDQPWCQSSKTRPFSLQFMKDSLKKYFIFRTLLWWIHVVHFYPNIYTKEGIFKDEKERCFIWQIFISFVTKISIQNWE